MTIPRYEVTTRFNRRSSAVAGVWDINRDVDSQGRF
jgi:hypothetical protein